jgi:hypothetical protein
VLELASGGVDQGPRCWSAGLDGIAHTGGPGSSRTHVRRDRRRQSRSAWRRAPPIRSCRRCCAATRLKLRVPGTRMRRPRSPTRSPPSSSARRALAASSSSAASQREGGQVEVSARLAGVRRAARLDDDAQRRRSRRDRARHRVPGGVDVGPEQRPARHGLAVGHGLGAAVAVVVHGGQAVAAPLAVAQLAGGGWLAGACDSLWRSWRVLTQARWRRESQPTSAPSKSPPSGAKGTSVITLTTMPSAKPSSAPSPVAAPTVMAASV